MRDITLGNTIYIKFTTRAFATGVPTTLAGTPVLSIYEENNLTQITAGVSVTVDYDSVVGLNQATIVATSGNGYEAGKSYDLVITAGTVGGVSVVGEIVGSFTVESSATFARLGAPAGASMSVDIAALPTNAEFNARTILSASYALEATVAALNNFNPAIDAVANVTLVATTTTNTDMRGTEGANTTAPDNASIAAILTDTADMQPKLGTPVVDISADIASVQTSVDSLSVGSAAISTPAESRVLTVGTETGTVVNTENLDGVYHQITDAAGAMDVYYQFDVGGNGIAVNITDVGRLNGNNDTLVVQAYNWGGASWDQIGTIVGINGTTDTQAIYNLLVRHTGTGANLGKIRIRYFAASGLTTADLFLDQVYLSYSIVSQSVGYANGEVWVDTSNGTAGTESFVNGVADNAVLTFADALTIAGNVGLELYHFTSDSNVTLAASFTNSQINSFGASLAFGGQDVSGSNFVGLVLSGIALSPTAEFGVADSDIGNITINSAHIINCGLSGMISLGTVASDIVISNCHSRLAAGILPVINFGTALVNHNVTVTHYNNGLEIQNFNVVGGGVDTFHISGVGTLVINANCDGGTINIRGAWKITDNSGGAVTLIYDDDAAGINSIAAQITALNNFDPATETVNSLVQGFLANVITETTAGRIADNFDTFFSNADAITTKVVDDVGGGGGGSADWTASERNEIRGRLGVTGTTAAGGNTPTLALEATINAVNAETTQLLLDVANVPTVSEFNARTPTAAELKYITDHAKTAKPVTFTGGTTTTAILGNVDGVAASSIDSTYDSRLLVFNLGTLDVQVTDIVSYVGSTKVATITVVTTAVTASHTAMMV